MGWTCTWYFVEIEFWIYLHIHSPFKSIFQYRGNKIMFSAFPFQFIFVPVLSSQPLLSPEGGCLIEVGLYSLTNQCYFSLVYTFWKIEISIKQCWFCGLSISIFCVGTFDMFKQLLIGDYWHPKIENVNCRWVCPQPPCWGKTDTSRCISAGLKSHQGWTKNSTFRLHVHSTHTCTLYCRCSIKHCLQPSLLTPLVYSTYIMPTRVKCFALKHCHNSEG